MSIALSSLMKKTGEDSDLLCQILSSFYCEQDEDIENFLHNKAVEFEKLSKARTYLICDEEQILKDSISGKELLQYAYDIIASAVDAVGGRYMMIECQDEKKLIEFYTQNEFQEVNRSLDGSRSMVQMIRKIA